MPFVGGRPSGFLAFVEAPGALFERDRQRLAERICTLGGDRVFAAAHHYPQLLNFDLGIIARKVAAAT
jgi:hypothetical protein